jgi:hypothetical protein
MDYIQVYQGSTPTVNVSLTNPDSTPYNASGAILYLTVKRNYADPNNIFSISATGDGAGLSGALTGLFTFQLTTGETSLCAGDYPAGLLLVDAVSGRNPVPVGYSVLPVALP